LSFAGAGGALLLLQRGRRLPLLRRLAAAGVAIGLFYALPLGALLNSSGQQFGTRLPWHAPVTGAATEFIAAFIPLVNLDGSWMQAALIIGTTPLLLIGCVSAHRRMPNIIPVTVTPVIVTFLAL